MQIIGHNSVNVHRIPTKVGTEIRLNEPFKCANFSAQSEYAFVFYGEVCEMKMKKKLKRNFVRSYLGNGWSDFLQIWYVDSPNWAARLQQIWSQSDKGSQSYIGVKIAFSFFLLIYSWVARQLLGPHDTLPCVLILNALLEYHDDCFIRVYFDDCSITVS